MLVINVLLLFMFIFYFNQIKLNITKCERTGVKTHKHRFIEFWKYLCNIVFRSLMRNPIIITTHIANVTLVNY